MARCGRDYVFINRRKRCHIASQGNVTYCEPGFTLSPEVDGKESMPEEGPRESVGPPTACSDSHPSRLHLRAQDNRVALGIP